MAKRPRGVRNNNPLNIRIGIKWKGLREKQTDKAFSQFVTPEYGARAAIRVFRTYRRRYDRKTVKAIIERWAPPNENDTQAYIRAVADRLGWRPSKVVSEKDYPALAWAMHIVECGGIFWDVGMFERGAKMA